jgi:hypothetical protein
MPSNDQKVRSRSAVAPTRRLLTRPPEPRFFDQATAAAYLGVSERSFETLWRSHQMPTPYRLGRRLLWDRKILDTFADELSKIVDRPT